MTAPPPAPQRKFAPGPFSDDAVRAAANFLRSKHGERSRRNLELWRRAEKDAAAVLRFIAERYQPRWVLQWGSILHPGHFDEISDIDFAVAGLDAGTFDSMFSRAEKLTSFPLHLIRWEAAAPEVRELLLRKGKIVYERG